MAIELDRFGPLLKSQDDIDVAGPAAAERDGFLDMVADGGALGARRNIDMDREEPLPEDRLIGPGPRASLRAIRAASRAARCGPPSSKRPSASRSERVVSSVAEGFPAGRFAAAEPQLLGLLGGEQQRGDAGVLVRAVAEGLRGAAAAGAPEVALALFDRHVIGRLLRRDWFGHLSSLPSPLLVSRAGGQRETRD